MWPLHERRILFCNQVFGLPLPSYGFLLFLTIFVIAQVRCSCGATGRRVCSAFVLISHVGAAWLQGCFLFASEFMPVVHAHVLCNDRPQLQDTGGAAKKSENQEWPSDEVSESRACENTWMCVWPVGCRAVRGLAWAV